MKKFKISFLYTYGQNYEIYSLQARNKFIYFEGCSLFINMI